MKPFFCLLALLCITPLGVAQSTPSREISALRESLNNLREDYESRIGDLEKRLALAEEQVNQYQAQTSTVIAQAEETLEMVEDLALAPTTTTRLNNTFNPAVGLILVGTAARQTSSKNYEVPGFSLPDESGPIADGFSLGESELNINSNVDDKFFGNLTLAIASDGSGTEVELEEAYIQTLALPAGFNMTAGRFFSGVGYLNGFHRHADNFIDRPIAYEVFLGGQFRDDGIQFRWLVPTNQYIELGGEWLRGDAFPASGSAKHGTGTWTLFAETGGDLGTSNSWKTSLGYIHASAEERPVDPENDSANLFSGDSNLYNLSFVWKWAPHGNPVRTNFKLQGEYFYREEDGLLDLASYSGDQTGGYLLGSWQFKPQWQVGYRYGRVNADNSVNELLKNSPTSSLLENDGNTDRNSLILTWKNSEFSQFKLQYTAQSGLQNDNRWVLQYVHGLGAHGAHKF
jgi:hypothetical protein